MAPTEWDKGIEGGPLAREDEREWIPLWLAGPVLAIGAVLGCIAIIAGLAVAYDWLLHAVGH